MNATTGISGVGVVQTPKKEWKSFKNISRFILHVAVSAVETDRRTANFYVAF